MKIGSYYHLPLQDQLSFIRLTIFIAGLEAARNFEARAREIVADIIARDEEAHLPILQTWIFYPMTSTGTVSWCPVSSHHSTSKGD